MYSLQCIDELSGHTDKVWDVSWSPDGKMLASAGSDKSIRIWGLSGEKNKFRNYFELPDSFFW